MLMRDASLLLICRLHVDEAPLIILLISFRHVIAIVLRAATILMPDVTFIEAITSMLLINYLSSAHVAAADYADIALPFALLDFHALCHHSSSAHAIIVFRLSLMMPC